MSSRVRSRTALAGAWIDVRLSRRSTVLGLLGAIGVAYLTVVQLLGVAAFSPDGTRIVTGSGGLIVARKSRGTG